MMKPWPYWEAGYCPRTFSVVERGATLPCGYLCNSTNPDIWHTVSGFRAYRVDRPKEPSSTVAFVDSLIYKQRDDTSTYNPDASLHTKGWNAVFVDGHAKWVRPRGDLESWYLTSIYSNPRVYANCYYAFYGFLESDAGNPEPEPF